MRDGLRDLLRRFVHKLETEMFHAEREHPFHIFRAGLRAGIEDGVAAASVGLEGMLCTERPAVKS